MVRAGTAVDMDMGIDMARIAGGAHWLERRSELRSGPRPPGHTTAIRIPAIRAMVIVALRVPATIVLLALITARGSELKLS
jgi:hypothetical protein